MMKMRIRRDPCKESEECSRFKLFFSLCATSSIKIISRILLQHGRTALKTSAEPRVPGRRFAHLHHLGVENVGVQNGGVFQS